MQWLCCHFCAAFCLPHPSVLFLFCILCVFFVTWFSHYLFPSEKQETGDCHLTHEFSTDHYQMVYRTQPGDCSFLSDSPGYFRVYWFNLRGFSRILICLQTNCAENLLNCLCPLHAFTHEHHQRKKSQASDLLDSRPKESNTVNVLRYSFLFFQGVLTGVLNQDW